MTSTMKKTTTPVSLYRLIYRSREVITQAVPDFDTEDGSERELRAIVSAARGRNKADNITGALLFTDAGFAQVLEGPREVLERTFERISADSRHADVTILSFTPLPCRSFPDWPLGFCRRPSLGPVVENSPDSGTPLSAPRVRTASDLLRLLERVVQQEDEWMAV